MNIKYNLTNADGKHLDSINATNFKTARSYFSESYVGDGFIIADEYGNRKNVRFSWEGIESPFKLRTFDDVPNVYEIVDTNIKEGNPAVAVFIEGDKLNSFCGLDNPKHYTSFNSWVKDVYKRFRTEAIKRTWNI
jgi:hypothetical protein